MRTPLTGLRLTLEAALEPGGDLRGAIASGIRSTDRIEQTIEELLGLARDTHRDRQVFDVADLIREVVAERTVQLGRDGRGVSIVILPDTPQAQASIAAVRQILAVLLDNARRRRPVMGSGSLSHAVRRRPKAAISDWPGLITAVHLAPSCGNGALTAQLRRPATNRRN